MEAGQLVSMKQLDAQRRREHSFHLTWNHGVKEKSWSPQPESPGLKVHFISKAQREGLSVNNAHPWDLD